jgi:hypothetical protein
MLLTYKQRMDLQHMQQLIVPADAIVKRKTLENFLTELSPRVQLQHQDENGERIYTAEIVVMSKQQLDHIESLILARAGMADAFTSRFLKDLLFEIKFK